MKSKLLTIIISSLLLTFITIKTRADNIVYTSIDVSHRLSDNQIRYISQLSDGRMVFTTSGNVNLYDGTQFTYIHRTSAHIYPLNNYDGFYRVYQEGDSLLWIKDYHKLMCIDLRKEQYIFDLKEYFSHMGIDSPIDDLFIDAENAMWLLTQNSLLQVGTYNIFNLTNNKGQLQDLATDKESLYLFYNTGDVVCYDISTGERLYSIGAYPENEQKLYGNTSLVVKGSDGFYQLRNGKKGAFFFFNPQDRAWKKIMEKSYALNTLILTPDRTAYISCIEGTWIVDLNTEKKGKVSSFNTVDGNTVSTEISTIFYDMQGGFWVGTYNRGLLYYHPSRYKFTKIGRTFFTDSPFEDITVQSFAEANNGTIYMKSHSVYYQYNPSQTDGKKLIRKAVSALPKEVINKFSENKQNHLFQNKHYTSLCTDSRGWTWGGTPDGLTLYKPECDTIHVFYVEDGLSNNFVHAIMEDKQHTIWVTTSYGISQIGVDSETGKIHFTNYNSLAGTLDGEYADNATFESSDGTLYFGGIDGFNTLNNYTRVDSANLLQPVFTKFSLYGQEIGCRDTYDGKVILTQAAPYTKSIELSYDQNFISLEFSALNYRNPTQTRYKYRLIGIDEDWREVSVDNRNKNIISQGALNVSYTNLPPGNYLFKVMASDNGWKWSGKTTDINITINAPWWKTTDAYILYAITFATLLAIAILLYTYQTKKKLKRQHKEEILLLRIHGLIEQCNQYEEEQKKRSGKGPYFISSESDFNSLENKQYTADTAFLAKAIELVEKHINVSGYSVEQLSKDLCIDRTGLYRKLITLLDQSPSLFIRNIRLQKAAQLIMENKLTIAEIADRVGFSSSSYLSKCFQEVYGCRPSEYVEKVRDST